MIIKNLALSDRLPPISVTIPIVPKENVLP